MLSAAGVSWEEEEERVARDGLRNGPGESVSVRVLLVEDICEGRSWDMSGAPQISQERREGWLRKVHRGHWNEASGSEDFGETRGDLVVVGAKPPIWAESSG